MVAINILPILLLLLPGVLSAAPAATLHLGPGQLHHGLPLGPYLSVLEDPGRRLTVHQVTSPANASRFVRVRRRFPNFGYSTAAYWARITLDNDSGRSDWLLELAYPTMDRMELYLPREQGGFKRVVVGDLLPFAQRPLNNPNFLIPLQLPPGKATSLYLRFVTKSTLSMPLLLWQPQAFQQQDQERHHHIGLYNGLLLAMIIFNLAFYLYVRDKNYLYYVLYNTCFLLYLNSFKGYAFWLLWPALPAWSNTALPLFASLAIFWGALFSRNFLPTKESMPFAYRAVTAMMVLAACSALAALLLDYSLSIRLATLLGAAGVLYLFVGLRALRQGYRPALYYLIAWTAFLSGVFLEALRSFGLVPSGYITMNATLYGSALQAVLLSLGLADRFNGIRKQNEALREATRELDIARSVLVSILPTSRPGLPGLSLHVTYRPFQEVGGDFYDFQLIGENQLGVLIADVSGHGLPAALIASMVKTCFTAQHTQAIWADQVLKNVNTALYGRSENQFVTAGYAVFDMGTRTLNYASAGHLPLIIVNRNSGQLTQLKPAGQLLGVLPTINCSAASRGLQSGDRVFLYTDGLTECSNPDGELFGEDQFLDLVSRNTGLAAEALSVLIEQKLRDWLGRKNTFEDDLALIVIDID